MLERINDKLVSWGLPEWLTKLLGLICVCGLCVAVIAVITRSTGTPRTVQAPLVEAVTETPSNEPKTAALPAPYQPIPTAPVVDEALLKAVEASRILLDRFKRVQAKTEIGVTYASFRDTVGELAGDVKIFAESEHGRRLPVVAAQFKAMLDTYDRSLQVWRLKLDGSPTADELLQKLWAGAAKFIRLTDEAMNPR